MIKKILTIFILTIFSLDLVGSELILSERETPAFKSVYSLDFKVALSETNKCEDCESKDCSHQEACGHHCSGLHQFAPLSHTNKLNQNLTSLENLRFAYKHLYDSPLIDPSLKPPTFS